MHNSKVTDAKLCILQVLSSVLYNVKQLVIAPVIVFEIMLAQCLATG
jgi:hypothetical protein